MRIALVHDDLIQWGGAERVLLGLAEIYPDAPIYTSLYDKNNNTLRQLFNPEKVVTSFLQKIPGWRFLYKLLLPFYPIAFEQFDFSEYDLIISSTTRFAKGVITKPETKHISYCHTPPRFLWHFSGEKSYGLLEILLTKLRLYDEVSARRVDHFIAGSKNAGKRIKKVYRRQSKIVYPFVDLDRFKNIENFDGGYFLVLGRSNRYKRVELAIKACQDLDALLKVAGGNWSSESIKGVEFLGVLKDQMVVNVLAGCKALIICAEEDFGLTAIEAQALGKPVVAFSRGGALETVIAGKTGILFDEQTVDCLKRALLKLESIKINSEDCRKNAARFSKENFIRNFKATVLNLL